jgi:mRNA interferase MazF
VSSVWPLVRGRVYSAIFPNVDGEKYYLVVSNNRRNSALNQVLAVRLTTTKKPSISSIVEIPHGEVFVGRAVCDDIVEIWENEVRRDLGALTPKTMAQIEQGLRAALGIT